MHRPNDFNGTTAEPSLLLRVRDFIEFVWFMMKVIGLEALEIYKLIGFIALDFYHIVKQECWQRRLYTGLLLLGVGFSFGSMVYTKPVITYEMVAAHNWWENGGEMPEAYYEARDRYIVAQEQADLVKVWFWRLREPYNTLSLEYQSKADNWSNKIAILERKREEKKHLVRVYKKILVRHQDQRVRNMGRMMRRALPFLFKRETLYDKSSTCPMKRSRMLSFITISASFSCVQYYTCSSL